MAESKWKRRLGLETAFLPAFEGLSTDEWRRLLGRNGVLSTNYDTVLALDWPHYCYGATESCGGPKGWCYTMQGRLATASHHRKVAMRDAAARQVPELFAELASEEVDEAVKAGRVVSPTLRFSGSGEVALPHLPALRAIARRGVQLWGFSRYLPVIAELVKARIAVIFSCDGTTKPSLIAAARSLGVPLGYTSMGIRDRPPPDAFVTFPLHRSGRIPEVVDVPSLCPKVVEEYMRGERKPGTCQVCRRCLLEAFTGASGR